MNNVPRTAYLYLALLLFIPVLFSSCKTKEWVPAPSKKTYASPSSYKFINESFLKFDRFSADFEADYSANGKVTSFSGQIRMLKDSFIWISASAVLGIEVSRILVTPDSFKIIDRIHSTYLSTGFSYLRRQTHPAMNLGILQSLLTGKDIPGYDTRNFTAKCINNNCELNCPERKNLLDSAIVIKSTIAFDKQTGKIIRQNISTTNPPSEIKAEYYDMETHSGQVVPMLVKAAVLQESQKFLSLTYKNVKINVPQKAPFKIPERYSKMY